MNSEKVQNIKGNEDELFIHFRIHNDAESFEKLYKDVESWLFKMVFRIVADKCAAEDIVHQSWLRVIEQKNKFNPQKGKFVNFIYTIAKNFALQWRDRANLEKRTLSELSLNQSESYNPGEIYEVSEMVRKSVRKLKNKNQQDAVLMFYFADLEISEIAERMNTFEHNVKNWLRRAKEKIEKDLKGKV